MTTPITSRAKAALTLWLTLKPDFNGPDPIAHLLADTALNVWLDAERAAWREIAERVTA